ncbi:hypothetical protein JMUB6875_41630 [Nocardia sp. JMUB6875]|uniref:PqqD family protein n=1 Tax=Nocardia sp. JMUB6875 TaxID=3158170 RepID=UPI0032E78375
MNWDSDSIPERRLDIRVRPDRGTLLIVNHELRAIEMDGAGAMLFRAMDGRRTVGDLAGLLVAEFGIEFGEALTDTVELVQGLAELDVVAPAGAL